MTDKAKTAARKAMEENPQAAREYRDEKASGPKNFLVGQMMQRTGGTVGPEEAARALEEVESTSGIDWPVTFTTHRRPVDATTVMERVAGEVPRWQQDKIPDDIEDPTAVSTEYRVSVYEDGSVEVEHVGTG